MLKKNKEVSTNKVANDMFDTIVRFLEENRTIEDVDAMIVNITAMNYATYAFYSEMVHNGDMTQSSESGYRSLSPEYSIWRNAMSDLDSNIKQLGLSPWARNNLKDIFEKKKKAGKKLDNQFFNSSGKKSNKRPNAEA